MKNTTIATINNVAITITQNEQETFVPIKPICEALGVASQKQVEKIKSHPILGSVATLRVVTGADGKQYEMNCLPLGYVFGWLFTINPDNVKEDAREQLISYQKECYQALYNHFNQKMENHRQRELSFERTMRLQKEMDELRCKEYKNGTDFARYLEADQELKREKAIRKSLTNESVNAMKGLFD